MAKKAKAKPARGKQKRLSPDHRRREFVAKATEFFSEQGFGGGTRDLARRLGVTQPLLYRYFPSKDDLIREVIARSIWSRSTPAGRNASPIAHGRSATGCASSTMPIPM